MIEKNDMKWGTHFSGKHVKFYVIHWGYKWVKMMSELISNRKKRFNYALFKFYWIDEIWWVCKKFLLATWLCNKWKQTLWSKRRGLVLKKRRCNLQLIILHQEPMIAYIYWNCIKVRRKTELRSEENALNKTETKIIMQCNTDHQYWPPIEC